MPITQWTISDIQDNKASLLQYKNINPGSRTQPWLRYITICSLSTSVERYSSGGSHHGGSKTQILEPLNAFFDTSTFWKNLFLTTDVRPLRPLSSLNRINVFSIFPANQSVRFRTGPVNQHFSGTSKKNGSWWITFDRKDFKTSQGC